MNLTSISYKVISQLLTSAMVYIQDNKRSLVECRALLDTCATTSFISESMVKKLHIPISTCSVPVGAINTINTLSKGIAQITIQFQSIHDGFRKDLTCLTIPTIADLIPSDIFPRNAVKIPPNIRLADSNFHVPHPVELLIGSGATLSLFSVGQIDLSRDGLDLCLQKTRLGWVVAGSANLQTPSKRETCHLTNLEAQLEKFWSIEDITTDGRKIDKENECETHFLNTVSRSDCGRYIVRLPFSQANKHLGELRGAALKHLVTLE